MKKYILLRSLLSSILLMFVTAVHAEIVVIVHPSMSFDQLDNNNITRLFLGKAKAYPNGERAIPINQDVGSEVRTNFNQELLNKSENAYKSYWSRLMFTGKATPPKDSGDNDSIKKLVATNPNIMGYIEASYLDGTVKKVFSLP